MFEVGKEVVCIKSHVDGHYRRGIVYPLEAIKKGCSDYPVLLNLGLTYDQSRYVKEICEKCKKVMSTDGTYWCNASDFAPIDNTLSDTTVEEILTEIGELEMINE